MTVYLLQHVSRADMPDEDVKVIGIYSSLEKAAAAVSRLKELPGFRVAPDGFAIDEYPLDNDHWTEGFGFAQ